MDELLVFAVKEEILRTVIDKHPFVLLTGWSNTGKTTSLLKVTNNIANRMYFSTNHDSLLYAKNIAPDIKIFSLGEDLTKTTDNLLIFDDFSTYDTNTKKTVQRLLLANRFKKTVIISKTVIDIKELIQCLDAVVRFRNTTAEVLYSKLLGKNAIEV